MRQKNRPLHTDISRRNFVTTSATALAGVTFAAKQLLSAERTPASSGAPDPKLIGDVVAANRILADQGILDAFGHVSARDNTDPNRYFLARHLAAALVTAADIMEFDLDSNPIDAQGRSLYLERFIHGEIYKARPDVKAVVHSHSSSVIPFSLSTVPLQPAFHMAAFVVEGVPVFDPVRDAGIHRVLVSSADAGHALAQTLGKKPAVLIRGHGTVVVGTSLPMVVGRSVYLEQSARIQTQAMALGKEVTYIDQEAAHKAAANEYETGWELWTRKMTIK